MPPYQSPRPAGKFQIIHLRTVAYPGEPIDVEEIKIVLDRALVSIRQLAVAMEALTSVVSQIAQMMHPSKSSVYFIVVTICKVFNFECTQARGKNEQDPQRSAEERDNQGT